AGVLFKNAEALETLQQADVLVVDKTGTLTEGKPRVMAVEPVAGLGPDDILRLAASLERASEHPLAAAIVSYAKSRGIPLADVRDFQSVTGKGVVGSVENHPVVVGNAALLAEQGISTDPLRARMETFGAEGHTVMLLAVGGNVVGLLSVADPIRPSTPEAIRL